MISTKKVFVVGVLVAACSFLLFMHTVWADTESGNTTIEFQVGASDCGNGVVDLGEQCDAGGSNGSCPATCSALCQTNTCNVGGGGGGDVIVTITDTEPTYSTIDVTWTATNGPIASCQTAWGTVGLSGPFPSSTPIYTETLGVFSTTIGGLEPETTYYVQVTCINAGGAFGSDTADSTTEELPEMIEAEITIIAIPEKRVPQPGGNLDTDFIVFIFDPSDSVLLTTISGTSGSDGVYTGVHIVPAGDGYVGVHKSDSHLGKKILNITFELSDNILDFSAGGTFELIAGDVKPEHPVYATLQDNIIEILDITYIDSDSIINTDDRIADLNRDGIVDILDLTLVDGNSDLQGDPISIL